ncbi:BREX-1 system adenine-specific DNA-methyltransferase PglX [Caballeronia humi]|uniref:site-specific DNA-methyltransferase (adenine-specific) n=1 Tax=Caballeronia humi TaxID=326474 RepID=A0A158IUJ3_9BURK|nr:BREX-1 system adenine-specific DNA-methyltransferase PglX [Caballeronia humi]SAL59750.1 N-6 DNA Methylase [Caballeronia humi]
MNKANLKSYAPKARLDFIAAVTARANLLGISANGASRADVRGDVAIIDGREWPARLSGQRDELIAHIKRRGFEQTMEEVAYTWFNRFAALRFMEIHEYLDHGWRVLSSRDGGLPEILRHASEVTLLGLNQDRAREMQLAGNQDNELYKQLLVAQCNELSRSMPFLFERIDDETELLLPENLLRTDSIISKLVAAVPEEDWQQIEVIGWLYQFYISEKKDEVIGKVVKSEDIPAATQLFTPNWIVKYLVQNSVGRLWLMANPGSPLVSQWSYYIHPADQTPEVQEQLDALIQTRMVEDGGSLNPETITVLDPACGSGHILVEAYELLKAIYLERGYQARSIPRLILEKNLYGLDIDDRAAQLAAFALLMKARADDRRLFNEPPQLNVLALQTSKGLDLDELTTHLAPFGIHRAQLESLLDTFSHAKTFGTLIQIPMALNGQLAAMTKGLQRALKEGDLYARTAAHDALPLVRQALILGMQFDSVVANPPYMGSKYYDPELKRFIDANFKIAKGDLYTCFMMRSCIAANQVGLVGIVNIPNWMFLSTFKNLREWLLSSATIETFSHNGRGVFGSDFGSCAFTFRATSIPDFKGQYKRLFEKQGGVSTNEDLSDLFLTTKCFESSARELRKIPGAPVAYWLSNNAISAFSNFSPLSEQAEARVGLMTSDNDRFLRLWWEVSTSNVMFDADSDEVAQLSGKRWFPHNKGGGAIRWYGNQEYLVDWQDRGKRIKDTVISKYPYLNGNPNFVVHDDGYYFRSCISWSEITIGYNTFRYFQNGFTFNIKGMSAFPKNSSVDQVLSFCNSKVFNYFAKAINPTVGFGVGDFNSMPGGLLPNEDVSETVRELIEISKADWDSFETSWNFRKLEQNGNSSGSLMVYFSEMAEVRARRRDRLKTLEESNNAKLIRYYELQDEFTSEVPEDQITLARADREKDCQRLISYAIGCTMGRYSLDEPGLVYALDSNLGFDASRYTTFPADADGIVPITDERWFEDDAASRLREFLRAVWGAKSLEGNMAWLAESLGTKGRETPDETIRRYLANKFFKDHLQTYKKRPIYWLFSSGKQGAFQALVYLHRYHEGTLARLRAEYAVPLMTKFAARLEMLDKDAAAATSTAARTKVQKQIESIRKKQSELLAYDEKLRHYADMRIGIDLDDGVKVNYAKFADLVAESKGIAGGSDD